MKDIFESSPHCEGSHAAPFTSNHADRHRANTPPLIWIEPQGKLSNGLSPKYTSAMYGWNGVLLERFVTPPCVVQSHGLARHAIVLQLAPYCLGRRAKDGKLFEGIKMAGSIDIIPAGISSRYDLSIMPTDSTTDDLVFHISQSFLEATALQTDIPAGQLELLPSFAAHDPQLEMIFRLLQIELENGCFNGALFSDSLAVSLAVRLITSHTVFGGSVYHRKGALSQRELKAVRDYIHEHLAEDLSLSRLASVTGLSPYHFARCFKLASGQTVHQFVLERRIECAVRMLKKGGIAIAEVASRCGFADQTHLGRHIRRRLAVTPGSLLPPTGSTES